MSQDLSRTKITIINMKKTVVIGLLLAATLQIRSQITISAARSAAIGTTVTVKGIVTSGPELGSSIRYFQDGTAGIAAFTNSASVAGFTAVAKGDSITVTGPLATYNNLLEIQPVNGFTIHSSGNSIPSPMVITPSGLAESTEGQLIQIQNCTFSSSGNFSGNTNYTVTSNSQTFVVRIVTQATSIVGTPIPTGTVNITGISSQFCGSPSSGCTTGYQLLPRTIADISSFSGINEFTVKESNFVYPNPASNKINLRLNHEQIKQVTITDVTGKSVKIIKENSSVIDISDLENGIYNISVVTDKHAYNSKFTVVR